MLERHKKEKWQARKRHREGWHKSGHKASGFPVILV